MQYDFDILLVEDEPVVTASILKILAETRLKVDAVGDAETALQHLKKHHYKMILCDFVLPQESGLNLLKKVRLDFSLTPFVMMTGYATRDLTEQALKAGALGFLPKPFEAEELLRVIDKGLNSL